jgi:hypothetical protein
MGWMGSTGLVSTVHAPERRSIIFLGFLLKWADDPRSMIHQFETDDAAGDSQAQNEGDDDVDHNANCVVIAVDAVVIRTALLAAHDIQ